MLWLVGALFGVLILYLFLTAPNLRNAKTRCEAIPKAPYAHRGLHDGSVPENSLTAFRRAAEKGYGIELDVHLTKDGHLAVMHDGSLKRMCGSDQRIPLLTLREVQSFRLLDTGERVPAFADVLKAVAPRKTPLIVEMKSDPENWRALPEKLLAAMQGYPGFWCVESFDPRMLGWFRRNAPQVVRGQLAYDPRRIGEKRPLYYVFGADLLTNFLSRPDFISYQHEADGNLSFRAVRRLFRPCAAAWTVQSQKDFDDLRKRYDLQIFEGFEPPVIANKEKEKQP